MIDVPKALKYLEIYDRLYQHGQCGRMLDPAVPEFYKDKVKYENILEWCIRKVREALQED